MIFMDWTVDQPNQNFEDINLGIFHYFLTFHREKKQLIKKMKIISCSSTFHTITWNWTMWIIATASVVLQQIHKVAKLQWITKIYKNKLYVWLYVCCNSILPDVLQCYDYNWIKCTMSQRSKKYSRYWKNSKAKIVMSFMYKMWNKTKESVPSVWPDVITLQ